MITLYSKSGCPRCDILKEKLDSAGIEYLVVSDENTIISKGIDLLPVLEADGVQMGFTTAVEWIKNR